MIDDLDDETIADHLSAEDELGVVIRAAVYVEHQLDALIEALTVNAAAVKRLQLDYSRKGDLAIAVGLTPRLRAPLSALGNIRNDFAHELTTSLTLDRVKSFYSSFDGIDKQIINDTYARVRMHRGDRWPKTLSKANALDQFQVLAISLRQAVKAARIEVLKSQGALPSA